MPSSPSYKVCVYKTYLQRARCFDYVCMVKTNSISKLHSFISQIHILTSTLQLSLYWGTASLRSPIFGSYVCAT